MPKPGGKSKAATPHGFDPASIKQAVKAAARAAGDPRLGTAIGRLRIERKLSDRQFAAAEAYGRLRGRHDRAVGIPRRTARSPLYDGRTGPSTAELDDRALSALQADHGALLAHVGPLKALLDRIIVDDTAPGPGELQKLRAGLEEMVEWFGIGEG